MHRVLSSSAYWLSLCRRPPKACSAPLLQGSPAKSDNVAPVDRAYLQSIWDGWASGDIEKQGRFYAQGPAAICSSTLRR